HGSTKSTSTRSSSPPRTPTSSTRALPQGRRKPRPMSEQLLTPEAQQWVGMVTAVPCAPITKADVLRFLAGSDGATGTDHSEPLAFPEDAPAPPMIYQALYRTPVPASFLTVDGVSADRRPPIGEGRGMNGEVELEFQRPLHIGDHLHGRRTLVSLEEKAG